jgi:pimeloyl-ACP methyl ester carboxylesterase
MGTDVGVRVGETYSPYPISSDAASLNLRRVVVDTAFGPVVVRTGRTAPDVGAPATILLHGAAGSWTTWTPLLQASDDAGTPLTDVVALDLPGWGESALPVLTDTGTDTETGTDTGTVTVEVMGAVVEEVARALGYASWRVIGHSLGGFIALDLAARAPRATLSVDLVSGTGRAVLETIREPLRGGRRLPWFLGMLIAMRAIAPFGGGRGNGTSGLPGQRGIAVVGWLQRVRLLRWLASPLFVRPADIDESVLVALAAEVRPVSFGLACRAAAAYDDHRWAAITCPVRSLRGEHDVFVGDGDAAAFAERIADFQEIRLEGAGHFAAVERPAAVLAQITAG